MSDVGRRYVERLVRQWEAADRKRGRAFLKQRREKHEAFWRERSPVPVPTPEPTTFTFDTAAVLKAVTEFAEHAIAGTITPRIRRVWVNQHYQLFAFPPAVEIADHIARCAEFKRSVADLVMLVLGERRVRAGMSQKDGTK